MTRTEGFAAENLPVPDGAYYGPHTARAVENFPISGLVFPRRFIQAIGWVKRACAQANMDGGDLDVVLGRAILQAASEVADGRWDAHFVVDVFQTGSGTSTNMNANEVIANRAAEILGVSGANQSVHAIDHVNLSQSSNDVIPTTIHLAAATAVAGELIPALDALRLALEAKATEFDRIVKSGRTHLMDALPVRLGQEFGGYAEQMRKGLDRATRARDALLELPLGGTAVGTGFGRRSTFPGRVIDYLTQNGGLPFREAPNHFEAQGARDACVEASGELKTIACSLTKIANDIRFMASGPRSGLGEIELPALQAGSSMMPGKVNPVLCEAMIMAAAQVIGNDVTISLCGAGGHLELNAMMPVLAYDLLQSIQLLSAASLIFAERCIRGIRANVENCAGTVERNLSLVTALSRKIGYDRAAAIARDASVTGATVREVASVTLSNLDLHEVLDARRMTNPAL